MKKLLILISILFFFACGGDDSSLLPPTPSTPTLGRVPAITDVVLFNAEQPDTPTLWFEIGDYMYFVVSATDRDLDMTTLYVTEYYPFDSDNIYRSISMVLPSQLKIDVTYTKLAVIEVLPPVGAYRFEFQIEDAQGNESNIFPVYILVH